MQTASAAAKKTFGTTQRGLLSEAFSHLYSAWPNARTHAHTAGRLTKAYRCTHHHLSLPARPYNTCFDLIYLIVTAVFVLSQRIHELVTGDLAALGQPRRSCHAGQNAIH